MKKILLLLISNCAFAQFSFVGDVKPTTKFFELNGNLIFAGENATSGKEMFITNGTSVQNIFDINAGATSSNPQDLIIYNNNCYFWAYDASGATNRIYKTDGTFAGSQAVATISPTFQMKEPIIYNNKIYFNDNRTSTNHQDIGYSELWSTNGTQAGTLLVVDIWNGSFTSTYNYRSNPYNFIVFNNWLFFTAKGDEGVEMYRSNGSASGTVMFHNFNRNDNASTGVPGNGNPKYYTLFNNMLYFTATSISGNTPLATNLGNELFQTNGNTTNNSTGIVCDIYAGSYSSTPNQLKVMGQNLFFIAFEPNTQYGLYKVLAPGFGCSLIDGYFTDGNMQTGTDPEERPINFTEFNSKLYFSATQGCSQGNEIWSSDGTTAGTLMLKNINTASSCVGGTIGSSFPRDFTVYNNKMYFTADDGVHGRELWVTDGTTAGTTMLADLNPGIASSNPSNLTVFNNELIFYAESALTSRNINTVNTGLHKYMDPTLGSTNFTNHLEIEIYPNPINDSFQFETEVIIDKVEVLNLQGQVIKTFESQESYNINDLSAGIYLVMIYSEKGKGIKKIIKN